MVSKITADHFNKVLCDEKIQKKNAPPARLSKQKFKQFLQSKMGPNIGERMCSMLNFQVIIDY